MVEPISTHRSIEPSQHFWEVRLVTSLFQVKEVRFAEMELLVRCLGIRSRPPGPGTVVPGAPAPGYEAIAPSISLPCVVPWTWVPILVLPLTSPAALGKLHHLLASLSLPAQSGWPGLSLPCPIRMAFSSPYLPNQDGEELAAHSS